MVPQAPSLVPYNTANINNNAALQQDVNTNPTYYNAASAQAALNGGSGTNTASPAITSGVNDPATLAAYAQGIANTQSSINNLPNQVASGNSAIDASATNALNQLLLGKNQANASYTTNKQQAGTDYVNAKNTIGSNAGSTLNGLLRLLGSRGAGGGSAYNFSAPNAVDTAASLQRTNAGNTFGANNQSLDTNWNNYLTGYDNQVAGVGSQRDQQKQGLQTQEQNNQAALLQQLATLTAQQSAAQGGNGAAAAQPFLDQANALLAKASNYTTSPINYQTQAYTAPTAASYTTNPLAAPTYNGAPATNDYTSPYLASLLGKKQTAGV